MRIILTSLIATLFISLSFGQNFNMSSSVYQEASKISSFPNNFEMAQFQNETYVFREDKKDKYLDVFNEDLEQVRSILLEATGEKKSYYKEFWVMENEIVFLYESLNEIPGSRYIPTPFFLRYDMKGKLLEQITIYSEENLKILKGHSGAIYQFYKDQVVFADANNQNEIIVKICDLENLNCEEQILTFSAQENNIPKFFIEGFVFNKTDGITLLLSSSAPRALILMEKEQDTFYILNSKNESVQIENILGKYTSCARGLMIGANEGKMFVMAQGSTGEGGDNEVSINYFDSQLKFYDEIVLNLPWEFPCDHREYRVEHFEKPFAYTLKRVITGGEHTSIYYSEISSIIFKNSTPELKTFDRDIRPRYLYDMAIKQFDINGTTVALYYNIVKKEDSNKTKYRCAEINIGSGDNTFEVINDEEEEVLILSSLKQFDETAVYGVVRHKTSYYGYSYKLVKIELI